MCVIAAIPAKTKLKKDDVERMWKKNPDGGGIAYIHPNGSLKTYKTMKFDQFWRVFNGVQHEFGDTTDIMMHTRIATHGTVDLSNVHPFQVDEHTVMAHNGIITGVGHKKGEARSDTRVFVEDLLPDLPDNWLDSPFIREMVADFVGYSKLMFLTTNPNLKKEVYIINKSMGTTCDGVWYSNSMSLPADKKPTYSYSANKYGWSSQLPKSTSTVTKPALYTPKAQVPVKAESSILMEEAALTDLRWDALGLDHEIFMSPDTIGWVCESCMGPVDSSGVCDCFDRVCTVCMNWTANCDDGCFDDYSRKTHLPNDYRFTRLVEQKGLKMSDVLSWTRKPEVQQIAKEVMLSGSGTD